MTEPRFALGVIALALLVPTSEAPAQLVSKVEAGALVSSRDGTVPANVFAVSPALRLTGASGSVDARLSAWRIGDAWALAGGDVTGSLFTPVRFRLRGELRAAASRVAFEPEMRSDQLDGQVRVHMPFRRGGIWVGGGLERPLRLAVVSSVDVTGGGAWTRIGPATVSGSLTNFYFTKLATLQDSTTTASSAMAPSCQSNAATGAGQGCWRQSQFRDVQGSLDWASGLIELSAQAGYRFGSSSDVGSDSRRWGSVAATYWMTSGLALVVGHSRQPASPSRGLPSRNLTSIGLALGYWPLARRPVPVTTRSTAAAGFELREADEGERTLVIRAGGIESVEIMGDFTEWEPKALTRFGRDHWEITLPIMPGVHEINVRLDRGKWRSPPGVPTRRDGFNGEVGVLVVE